MHAAPKAPACTKVTPGPHMALLLLQLRHLPPTNYPATAPSLFAPGPRKDPIFARDQERAGRRHQPLLLQRVAYCPYAATHSPSVQPAVSAPAWGSKQQQHSQHSTSAHGPHLLKKDSAVDGYVQPAEGLLHQLQHQQQQQAQHMCIACLVLQGYHVNWQPVLCGVPRL